MQDLWTGGIGEAPAGLYPSGAGLDDPVGDRDEALQGLLGGLEVDIYPGAVGRTGQTGPASGLRERKRAEKDTHPAGRQTIESGAQRGQGPRGPVKLTPRAQPRPRGPLGMLALARHRDPPASSAV